MSGAAQAGRRLDRTALLGFVQSRIATGVLVAVAVVAGIAFPDFLRGGNLDDIATAACFVGLVTIGQTVVIIMGGFDLSVGSMVGLGTVIAAYAAPYGWDAALFLPILAGSVLGMVNGVLIARGRMAPFIVTLATLLAVRGATVAIAGESLVIANPGTFGAIANGTLGGVGNLVWILFIAYALAGVVLNATPFGTALFAVGGNEEAARMMGVRVESTKFLSYCLSGAIAGLSGALLAAHLDSGLSQAGTGYELQSIASAVIGGVLLTGGVGTMMGALSGVLLLQVIENVINQVGTLSAFFQGLASGIFLLLAVILQSALSRWRET